VPSRPLRYLAAAVSLSGALALLTGCGGDPQAARDGYATKVCTSIAGYEKALQTGSQHLADAVTDATRTPAQVKTAVTTMLDQLSAAGTALTRQLQAAGPAPGGHGKQITAGFVTAAQQAHQRITTQRASFLRLPATNQGTLQAGAQAFTQAIEDGANELVDALNTVGDLGDGALNTAFRTNKTCSGL